MDDETTAKHTITTNEEFIDELCDTYPCANTVSQAILAAAHDGVEFRQVIGDDLETFVRHLVRDELESDAGAGASTIGADD